MGCSNIEAVVAWNLAVAEQCCQFGGDVPIRRETCFA